MDGCYLSWCILYRTFQHDHTAGIGAAILVLAVAVVLFVILAVTEKRGDEPSDEAEPRLPARPSPSAKRKHAEQRRRTRKPGRRR